MTALILFLVFQALLAIVERFFHFWLAVDQVLNVCVGSGWADESYSAYCYRENKWQRNVINKLFFWQADHCREAYWAEKERRHLHPEYRL